MQGFFLWTPKEVLSVESYDGETVYEEGIDYLVEGDELVIPEGSHIPVTGWDTFLYPDFDTAKKAGEANRICKRFRSASDYQRKILKPMCHRKSEACYRETDRSYL